jgi:hypothetical protein
MDDYPRMAILTAHDQPNLRMEQMPNPEPKVKSASRDPYARIAPTRGLAGAHRRLAETSPPSSTPPDSSRTKMDRAVGERSG